MAFYLVAPALLIQALLITQDNQDSINELAAQLNAQKAVRHSFVHRVQQWMGNKLK